MGWRLYYYCQHLNQKKIFKVSIKINNLFKFFFSFNVLVTAIQIGNYSVILFGFQLFKFLMIIYLYSGLVHLGPHELDGKTSSGVYIFGTYNSQNRLFFMDICNCMFTKRHIFATLHLSHKKCTILKLLIVGFYFVFAYFMTICFEFIE